jgi:hypothetical protein
MRRMLIWLDLLIFPSYSQLQSSCHFSKKTLLVPQMCSYLKSRDWLDVVLCHMYTLSNPEPKWCSVAMSKTPKLLHQLTLTCSGDNKGKTEHEHTQFFFVRQASNRFSVLLPLYANQRYMRMIWDQGTRLGWPARSATCTRPHTDRGLE